MTTHTQCCEAVPRSGLVRGLLAAGILVLLPKCPACLAAYIAASTGLGLTFTASAYLRAVLIALCVASLAHLALQTVRRSLNRSASSRTG